MEPKQYFEGMPHAIKCYLFLPVTLCGVQYGCTWYWESWQSFTDLWELTELPDLLPELNHNIHLN